MSVSMGNGEIIWILTVGNRLATTRAGSPFADIADCAVDVIQRRCGADGAIEYQGRNDCSPHSHDVEQAIEVGCRIELNKAFLR